MPSPIPQNQEENHKVKNFIYEQRSFESGMNMQVDPTRLGSNEYSFASNIRTRYGVVELVKLPSNADTQGNFVGKNVQGVYSAGPYVLVFADGKAFYKDIIVNPAGAYTQIVNFQMDALVSTIYIEQVPASSMNYLRKLDSSTGDNAAGVGLFTSGGGSPQCVICQDGINQPWLIFADGTARVSQTYAAWSIDNREYIPVGTIMLYVNGILYVVGPAMTGSLSIPNRQIFRSVTGRPIDFVVNIDSNGDKGGDATTTAFAVDYDEITAMNRLNSNISGFLVSTAKNCYIVSPQTTSGQIFLSLPFNEPLFTVQWIHNTGMLNNFSLADKNGDAAFVDYGGIRSFNAVMQNRNEGQNLPFSKKVALLFADIVQSVTAAVDYDDYCFFSVQTIYGRAVLVYDTIQDCWIGMDIYDNFDAGEAIEQFCVIKVGSVRKLYVKTSGNRIFELFAGTEYATGSIYLGEWCSNDCNWEQQPDDLKCVFTDVETDGNVTVTPFMDSKRFIATTLPLTKTTDGLVIPLAIPFGVADKDVVRNINFGLDQVDSGWKVGVLIQWNFGAQLTHVRLEAEKFEAAESTDEQAATMYP